GNLIAAYRHGRGRYDSVSDHDRGGRVALQTQARLGLLHRLGAVGPGVHTIQAHAAVRALHHAHRLAVAAQLRLHAQGVVALREGAELQVHLPPLHRPRRRRRIPGNDGLDLHRRRARLVHPELERGDVTQVDDAAFVERSAVVDAHDDAAPVAQVAHAGVAGQRQRLVGGAVGTHVVGLHAGRRPAMELGTVPGGDAALPVA